MSNFPTEFSQQHILNEVYNASTKSLKTNQGALSSATDTVGVTSITTVGAAVPTTAYYLGMRDSSGNLSALKSTSTIGDGGSGNDLLAIESFVFNGTNHDRMRGNIEGTLLASAARTATTNTTDQTNHNNTGVLFILNVTSEAAAETLSLKIQAKDPISSNYVDYVDFGVVYDAATAAPGTFAFLAYPGATDADLVTAIVSKSAPVPRTWRAVVTHSSTGSWTYSLAYSIIR